MAIRDAALERRTSAALGVAAAAARGVLLTSLGPGKVPQDSGEGADAYWHMDEDEHRRVMERVLAPLIRMHVKLAGDGGAPGVPTLLALEVMFCHAPIIDSQ